MKKVSILLLSLLALSVLLAGCTIAGQGGGMQQAGNFPSQTNAPPGTSAVRPPSQIADESAIPDFAVPLITYTHLPGGDVTITAQVKNTGTRAYQGKLSHFLSVTGPRIMASLIFRNNWPYPINGYTTETFTFSSPLNGTYHVTMTADYYREVLELNENNNIGILNFTISDMNADQNYHLGCDINLQCIHVLGLGADACHNNAECSADQNYHFACDSNSQCVSVPGTGQDQCFSNADCMEHSACVGERCVLIYEPGEDQCISDADCTSQTHLACRGSHQCLTVSGSGSDECLTDADCQGIDLIVGSILHTSGWNYNGTYWLDYNVLIQNIGNQPYVGPVSLQGHKALDSNSGGGAVTFGIVCTVNLPPTATASCYHSYSGNNRGGFYELWAYVDSNHSIPEANEYNNDLNVTFHIP